jgi:hypothetical protein
VPGAVRKKRGRMGVGNPKPADREGVTNAD